MKAITGLTSPRDHESPGVCCPHSGFRLAEKREKDENKKISSNGTGGGYDDVYDRVRRK